MFGVADYTYRVIRLHVDGCGRLRTVKKRPLVITPETIDRFRSEYLTSVNAARDLTPADQYDLRLPDAQAVALMQELEGVLESQNTADKPWVVVDCKTCGESEMMASNSGR